MKFACDKFFKVRFCNFRVKVVIQANQERTVHQVLRELQDFKGPRGKWVRLDQKDGRANRDNQALLADRVIEDIRDSPVLLDLLDHLDCRFVSFNKIIIKII